MIPPQRGELEQRRQEAIGIGRDNGDRKVISKKTNGKKRKSDSRKNQNPHGE